MQSNGQSTILIVSRRNPDPDLNTSFLHQPDIRVRTSDQGPQAIDIARREKPDLIIEALHAAGSNGDGGANGSVPSCLDLKSDPQTAAIPLILVSEPKLSGQASAVGADRLLCTPLAPDEFFDAVRHYVPLPTRSHSRHSINLRFTFRLDGRLIQAFTRNISLNGSLLKTDRRVPPGTHLQLTFYLPGESEGVQCGGRVVGAVGFDARANQPTGIGVEFEGILDPDLTRLETFIERYGRASARFGGY